MMYEFDCDEFVDKACETCSHSYPCDMYGMDLACEYNDKVVWKNYDETENYMSCGGLNYDFRRGGY